MKCIINICQIGSKKTKYFLSYFLGASLSLSLSLSYLTRLLSLGFPRGWVFCLLLSVESVVMADDVTRTLEKMKLTVEEEETISISDESRKEDLESCELSLIGKFLTCRSFNKRAALMTLKKAWGLEDGVQVVEVGTNLFQFKFRFEFELNTVYIGGIWSFDNQALLLTRWKLGMMATSVKFDSVPLWVQI